VVLSVEESVAGPLMPLGAGVILFDEVEERVEKAVSTAGLLEDSPDSRFNAFCCLCLAGLLGVEGFEALLNLSAKRALRRGVGIEFKLSPCSRSSDRGHQDMAEN
jgi:hypothetical protein